LMLTCLRIAVNIPLITSLLVYFSCAMCIPLMTFIVFNIGYSLVLTSLLISTGTLLSDCS